MNNREKRVQAIKYMHRVSRIKGGIWALLSTIAACNPAAIIDAAQALKVPDNPRFGIMAGELYATDDRFGKIED